LVGEPERQYEQGPQTTRDDGFPSENLGIEIRNEGLVAQNSASWNLLTSWLEGVKALQRAIS
jgi:hypothetical protein